MNMLQTLKDIVIMSERCFLLSKRNPDTILTSIVTPILTMLLFAYVLGGAMQTGDTSYVNYIVPGIILQCLGQCAASTAIAVCSDIKSGIIERFCTMPIKRASILTGHVLEAYIRNMMTALLIILVASLIGFRPQADVVGWCIALFIISLYILTLSWISVYFGILANSPEGAGAFAILAIALPCLSSGFVPIDTMPKLLQIFAEHQPMTPIIDSLRALLLNETLETSTLLYAILWCAVLLFLFYILSVKAFKKKNSQ